MKSVDSQLSSSRRGAISSKELIGLSLILLVGLGLRIWYLADFSQGPDFASPGVDAEFHDYWARGLATGNWTPPANAEDPKIQKTPFLRPPGYPYFLAGIYRALGLSYFAPRVVQFFMGLLSALLGYVIGRRWFGIAIGMIACAFLSWYWAFIYFENEFHAPTLMIFLTLAMFYALGRFSERGEKLWAVGGGVLFGLSALVLPNVLLFGPVTVVWLLVVGRQKAMPPSWRPAMVGGLAFSVSAAAAILPATIRNYIASGEFVPITTNAGINLYIGNHDGAAGYCLVEIPELGKFETCFDYPALVRSLEAKVGRHLTHAEVDAWFRGRAMDFIRENPGRFVSLLWTKFLMFWGPSEISHNKEVQLERDFYPPLHVIPINFACIIATAVPGIFVWLFMCRQEQMPIVGRRAERVDGELPELASFRRGGANALVLLMALFILVFFISILPFFNAARYRVPIIPFLMFFSAMSLAHLSGKIRARQWRGVSATSLGIAGVGVVMALWPFKFEADKSNWHYSRGYCFARTGRIEPAIAEYKAAIAADPGNMKAHYNLGGLLQQKGDLEEARTQLELASRQGANDMVVQRANARMLAESGQFAASATAYEAVLRRQPDDVDALLGLALALSQQSKFDESVRTYERALAVDPESANTHYELAMTLTAAGRLPEAEKSYRRAIELKPDFFEARNNIAALLVQMNRLDDAAAAFRDAIAAQPESREAHLNLAFVLGRAGRTDEGVELLRKWLSSHAGDAEAQLRIGQMLLTAGRKAEAKPWFEAVLKAYPGNEAATKGLAEAKAGGS